MSERPEAKAADAAAAAAERVARRAKFPPGQVRLSGMRAAEDAAARTAALVASQEWCMRMARLEGDAEIGAGRLAADPVFEDGDPPPLPATHDRAGALPDTEGD